MSPHQRGGGHIDFDADPVGIGIGFSIYVSFDLIFLGQSSRKTENSQWGVGVYLFSLKTLLLVKCQC